MKEAEERKQIREKDEQRELREKQQRDLEKEQHRKNVQQQMLNVEESRRKKVLNDMKALEEMVKRSQTAAEKERQERARLLTLKRKDREENVKRIERINEYQREKIMERIEQDNERAERIRVEREALLQTRQNLRKQIDLQKEEMLVIFEKMKKKGKMEQKDLKQLKSQGVSTDRRPEKQYNASKTKKTKKRKKKFTQQSLDYPRRQSPQMSTSQGRVRMYSNEASESREFVYDRKETGRERKSEKDAIAEVKELRTRLHRELMEELEKEQEKEDERDELLKNVKVSYNK